MFPGVLVASLTISILSVAAAQSPDLAEFVSQLKSSDDAARAAARQRAPTLGAIAVPVLVELLESDARATATTARLALTELAHQATHPDAHASLPAVEQALSAALATSDSAGTQRELLHLLGFVGRNASIGTIEQHLRNSDQHVREAARLALENIASARASQALVRAIRAELPESAELLFSLGKTGDRGAIPFLLGKARESTGPVRLAALTALAHLAAESATGVFERAIEGSESDERTRILNEYLRLADELLASAAAPRATRIGRLDENPGAGQADDETDPAVASARRMYRFALATASADYQRERALRRLSEGPPNEQLELLIASLNDESRRVREFALGTLTSIEGAEATQAVLRAYSQSEGSVKATLLRAIAARNTALATPLLGVASRAGDDEVKITALDILGKLDDPEMAETYERVARSGSRVVRTAAVNGYLTVAESAARNRASTMFSKALEFSTSDAQLTRAIDGIAKTGPGGLAALEPFTSHATVGARAATVYVDLAEALADVNVDDAAPILLKVIAGKFPESLKARAADKLRAIGRDPQAGVLAQGFILDWWLIGPIADDKGDGLERPFFPEAKREFEKEHRIGPRKYVWQRPRLLTVTGAINFLPRFRRSVNRIAYGYTELVSDTEQDAVLKIGSDDGVACFVNDVRVHVKNVTRGLTIDEDVVRIKLRAGTNRLLVKVKNGEGDWGMAVRLTKPDGMPLVLPSALAPRK